LLLFNCWKCCAHMSRRNTSQRPPEPPQDRSDRFRAGKPAPTGRFQRKKKALRPPMAGRGKVGERDLVAVILLGDQRHRRVHPRRWTRHSISMIIRCMSRRTIRRIILRSFSLTSINLMCINNISMRIIMSSLFLSRSSMILSRSSLILRRLMSMMILSSLSSMMVGSFSGGTEGGVRGQTRRLYRGPSKLTLLPHFCGHVACRIWVDADVSLFYFFYYLYNLF